AEHTIRKVRMRIGAREAEYLHGFLERGRGRHGQAIQHYELALHRGYGGLAIHRDLAECYLSIGEPAKASRHIAEAHAKDPGNRFVLEIWLKASCADQDSGEDTARQLLAQLLPQLGPHEQALAMYYRSRVQFAFG